MLPFSRAKEATGYGFALGGVQLFQVHKEHFPELVKNNYDMCAALVQTMTNRVRDFTKSNQQSEKMMALGKLSAGIAHELNNPSAAVVRSADTLKKHLKAQPEKFKRVMELKLTAEQVDTLNNLLFSKMEAGLQHNHSLMEKTEKEDELAEWMEERELDEAYAIAENLVDFSFTKADLEQVLKNCGQPQLRAIINWMDDVLTTEKLVLEIADASNRISTLVSSVKSYTHMDRSQEATETDLHKGLNNTLIMLGHKLRDKGIELHKEFEDALPQPIAVPGQLNQVWTNMIDNAIDAMADAKQKVLTITTSSNSQYIIVEIADTGSGIPEDIQDKVFDPFFTTKDIGEGTGMGLELVQQIICNTHHGKVDLRSKPGETVFKVCLPISKQVSVASKGVEA